MNKLGLLILSFLLLLLSGCALLNPPQTKTTRISIDPDTKVETTIIEEPVAQTAGGFWKSDNLAAHYDFEKARNESHEKAVDKKTSAIVANTAQMMRLSDVSDTEKLLAGIISNMQIDKIQTSPAPSGVKTPTTVVDFANGNAINLGNLFLNGWSVIKGGNGDDTTSSQVDIVNSGDGQVLVNSNRNSMAQQTTKTTVGNTDGGLTFSGMPNFTPSQSDSNDTTATRTNSPNSEETALW